jgi:methylenetetrahydrofolate reductase (NADPH)
MNIKKKLASGEFLLLAEMEPPKGVDFTSVIAHATQVKDKVDAFVVPEMSNAVMKMSALGGCALLQSRGLETVMQVCCRDRNRLALQADLLAAYALGISSVMVITGVEPSFGDHQRARPVHDIDLLQLLEGIQQLQSGRDMAGIELSGAPTYCVGSTVNSAVRGELLDLELEEMGKKMAAGVEFFITQPVFELQSLSRFMKRVEAQSARIIPTVLLLKSAGMARYIDQHLPHVRVPGELITRIQKAPDKTRECVLIARELLSALKGMGTSGVLVSTIGWEDKLPGIVEG